MLIVNNENVQVHLIELDVENTGHITNTYIIKDKQTGATCVIDPAFDDIKIKQTVRQIEGTLHSVIITHSHADHIAALAKLVEGTNVKVYIHELDYDGLYSKVLNEEDIVKTKVLPVEEDRVITVQNKEKISIGDTSLEVIHTPGHTQGSMTLFDEKSNILYSGDTIFKNTYGRTDLITGSRENMKESLDKLFDRFDDIQVLPGHGEIFNLKDSKRRIRLLFAYKG